MGGGCFRIAKGIFQIVYQHLCFVICWGRKMMQNFFCRIVAEIWVNLLSDDDLQHCVNHNIIWRLGMFTIVSISPFQIVELTSTSFI